MIYDRTQKDVNSALEIFRTKIDKNIELTEDDIAILERGMATLNTINRIENKQIELQQIIKNMLYGDAEISNKTWDDTQFFYKEDLERIVNNTANLRKTFYVFADTPENPRPEYHYREFNLIERILSDIELMIEYVKNNYKECGNFECGEA